MRGATNAVAAAGGEELFGLYTIIGKEEHVLPKYCKMLVVDGSASGRPTSQGAYVLAPGMSCEIGSATVSLSGTDGRTIEISKTNMRINVSAFW